MTDRGGSRDVGDGEPGTARTGQDTRPAGEPNPLHPHGPTVDGMPATMRSIVGDGHSGYWVRVVYRSATIAGPARTLDQAREIANAWAEHLVGLHQPGERLAR